MHQHEGARCRAPADAAPGCSGHLGHWFLLAALVFAAGSSGCREPSSPKAGAQAVVIEPPPTDEALMEVDGQQLRITREIASAIRAALLAQIEKSDLPHKQVLLDETRAASVSFSPGLARFGLWVLSAPADRLQLIFRQPSEAQVASYYQAEVSNRAGAWQVEDLRVMWLRRGR
jgi:hypothetical protein